MSVIVLAYNEAPSLADACAELLAELDALAVTSELVIVDDGSTDETPRVCEELRRQNPRVRIVRHSTNLGLGGGYRTGFSEARGEFVTFFPADRQFPPEIIGDFLPRMAEHDLVLGYLPHRKGAIHARVLSALERALYRILFGRMPRFQGILMFRRSLLQDVELRSQGRGWTVLMEFILRASRRDRRIVSVPTKMRPRLQGESKVNNLRTILSNVSQMMELWRRLPFR